MKHSLSLRMRLTLIILIPLLIIAGVVAVWQLRTARDTAAGVFDRSLLSAALAVANDVAISGGDALSRTTQDILADTSGGPVFYHVYAPDGVIVAGYATPPVGIPQPDAEAAEPTYFNARYLGRDVSGVRLQTRTEIEGFSGVFTTTVWQDTSVRDAFLRDLLTRSLFAVFGLIASVALVVWFGVRLGLRPLLDLQEAIEQRSTDELSPIRRAVPVEVQGIVERLNSLFGQVSRSMTAQAEFISNAAHQLRNPVAGVLALAEAVHAATSQAEAKRRSADLLTAARESADLTQRLLTLERAKAQNPAEAHDLIGLRDSLEDWAEGMRASLGDDASLDLELAPNLGRITGDATMLREALRNLVDNARRHGGPKLAHVVLSADREGDYVRIAVADDGCGIDAADVTAATERFSQLSPASGSGLGLPIVETIAEGHGGWMTLEPLSPGLRVTLHLPASGEPRF